MRKKSLGYLIFDLDRVLFDTGELIKILEEKGIKVKDQVGAFNLKIAKKVDWPRINTENLVYPGIFKLLSDLKKNDYCLYLLSEGNIEGQLFKLRASGLDKFFPPAKRFIFENEKEKKVAQILKKIPKKAEIWLFDDKPSKLKIVKDSDERIQTVLVCRGLWWQTKIPGFKPDYKIKDLTEIEEIL